MLAEFAFKSPKIDFFALNRALGAQEGKIGPEVQNEKKSKLDLELFDFFILSRFCLLGPVEAKNSRNWPTHNTAIPANPG